MSMINSNDTIGNRFRDLPICSTVPQPLRHRVPLLLHSNTDLNVGPQHNDMKEIFRMWKLIFWWWRKIEPNRISYETGASEMNCSYSPGWSAWVDRNGCGVYTASGWRQASWKRQLRAPLLPKWCCVELLTLTWLNFSIPVRKVKIRIH
jgi:hypothetical protein